MQIVSRKTGIDRQSMRLDPDGEITRLRQFGPVFWSDLNLRWIVLGQQEGLSVLQHRQFCLPNYGPLILNLADKLKIDLSHLYSISQFIPFLHNGERHKKTRAAITRLTAELQPAYINHLPQVIDRLLSNYSNGQTFNFTTAFSDLIHINTISSIIGLAPADMLDLNAKLSAEELNYNNSVTEFVESNSGIKFAFNELKQLTDSAPSPQRYVAKIRQTLLDLGLESDFDSQIYCLMAICILGKDTISGALSLSMRKLFEEHGQSIDPKKALQGEHFSREMLRTSAPVNLVEREAIESCALGSHQISKGDRLLVVIRAINTDPSAYACPYKSSGAMQKHFSFGSGIHACVGRTLAMEAVQAAFAKLSEFEALHQVDDPVMGSGRNTRKVNTLKMRLQA